MSVNSIETKATRIESQRETLEGMPTAGGGPLTESASPWLQAQLLMKGLQL